MASCLLTQDTIIGFFILEYDGTLLSIFSCYFCPHIVLSEKSTIYGTIFILKKSKTGTIRSALHFYATLTASTLFHAKW